MGVTPQNSNIKKIRLDSQNTDIPDRSDYKIIVALLMSSHSRNVGFLILQPPNVWIRLRQKSSINFPNIQQTHIFWRSSAH